MIKERIEQLDVKEKLCIINPNLKRLIKIHLHLWAHEFANISFSLFFVKGLQMAEEHGEELEEPGSDMDSFLGR